MRAVPDRSVSPTRPVRPLGLRAAALALAVACLTAGVSVASGMLELAELVSHPEQYDRQMVSVTGRVTNLRMGTTRAGARVYGFLLQQGDNFVKVLGVGGSPLREQEHVLVEGVFHRLRRAGRHSVYNEIKASLVRPLDRLHPDLVG